MAWGGNETHFLCYGEIIGIDGPVNGLQGEVTQQLAGFLTTAGSHIAQDSRRAYLEYYSVSPRELCPN